MLHDYVAHNGMGVKTGAGAPKRAPRLVALALLGVCSPVPANAAASAPARFANIFADHAVLQRDRPIAVWGRAAKGARVIITIDGRSATARADAEGRWRATLPAMTAGGPYRMTLSYGAAEVATIDDVMIGDVYLCGGQSNMEFPVTRSTNAMAAMNGAADDALRFVTIPQLSQPLPADDLAEPAKWLRASPATVGEASAVCYYMARSLRASQKVPIGFIGSYWGGTRIESWISPAALATQAANRAGVAAVALYGRDRAAAMADEERRREEWWRAHDPAWAEHRAWSGADFDDSGWKTMAAGPWRQAGDAGLADHEGVVWLRATVTLSEEQARAGAAITLGPVDQFDDLWVNGVRVGGGSVAWVWRDYALPPGTLHAGRNVIAMRILGGDGGGGLTGAPEHRTIRLAGGASVPLPREWRYQPGIKLSGVEIPPAPWDVPTSLTTLYNGMIAPIAGYGLTLAAWYQGESNAGEADRYRALLSLLIRDWRRSFSAPALPFLVVQLPGFGAPAIAPRTSGWAALRQAQADSVAGDRAGGIVPTLDLGDRFDIHPTQKTIVGERLARLARAMAYGQAGGRGPTALSVRRDGADLVIGFGDVTGGLRTYSASQPIGFEACAADNCRFVVASVHGDTVVLPGANRPDVTEVRYAWADAPVVNLFDGSDWPVGTFRLPVAR